MSKNFRSLLLDIALKPVKEQKKLLNQTLEDWKGDLEQMDDIIVIGLKVQ
jgi:hypothetical protein